MALHRYCLKAYLSENVFPTTAESSPLMQCRTWSYVSAVVILSSIYFIALYVFFKNNTIPLPNCKVWYAFLKYLSSVQASDIIGNLWSNKPQQQAPQYLMKKKKLIFTSLGLLLLGCAVTLYFYVQYMLELDDCRKWARNKKFAQDPCNHTEIEFFESITALIAQISPWIDLTFIVFLHIIVCIP